MSPATRAAALAALTLVWGTQFLIVKIAVADVPPLRFGALRFALVAVVAQLALGWRRPTEPRAASTTQRLLYGLSHAAAVGLLYWGQARTDSAVAAALTASSPVLLALVAHRFVPDERLEGAVLAGSVLGLLGSALLVAGAGGGGGATPSLAGTLAVLAAAVASASTKLTAKRLTLALPPAALLRDMGVVVAVTLGAASWLGEGDVSARWTPRALAALVWLGLVGSVLATGVYLLLLRQVAVARLGYLQFAHAGVAVVVGVIAGGESLGPGQLAGACCVLGGGMLVTRPRRAARPQA